MISARLGEAWATLAQRAADRSGQGIVEYGLILALTSALTVVWLVVFGGAVGDALAAIAEAIDQATGG